MVHHTQQLICSYHFTHFGLKGWVGIFQGWT